MKVTGGVGSTLEQAGSLQARCREALMVCRGSAGGLKAMPSGKED